MEKKDIEEIFYKADTSKIIRRNKKNENNKRRNV